jgi:hypothetical protein
MNNFVFKIFGAPHTFDLYQGSGSEIGYFQTFDNGSKENTKLVIHRMSSVKVSYSYLRYNFLSGGGRENSWFGMSVVFEGEYCRDITKIYELFDWVYNNIIIKKGNLISLVKNNPKVQAKYLVRTFAEAADEVMNIENNIINNLKDNFSTDIVPLDNSFSQESTGLINMSSQKDNSVFVNALRKYSWLSISPDYKEVEEVFLSPEEIAEVDYVIANEPAKISKISIDILKGKLVQTDIDNSDKRIKAGIKIILPFLKKQPELQFKDQKLYAIQKQLDDLITAASEVVGSAESTVSQSIMEAVDTTSKNTTPPKGSVRRFKDLYNKKKPSLYGIVGVIVFVVLILVIIIPFGSNPKDATTNTMSQPISAKSAEDKNEELIDEGYAALSNKNFDAAIKKFAQADSPDLANNAKQKAIQDLNEKAAQAKTPQEAIKFLEQTRKYGNKPDTFIAEFQKKIDDAAKLEQKRKDDAAKKAADEKEKADNKKSEKESDCLFGPTKKTADQYLIDIENQDIKAGRYASAVSCCDLIINSACTTQAQKDKAKRLKRSAQSYIR